MQTESVQLVKGEKIEITKTNPGLRNVGVGLGWDVSGQTPAYDLDAFAFALTGGKLATNKDILYYGETTILGGLIQHSGDNLTGAGEGDDEMIGIKLSELPDSIDTIIVGVNIYEAASRNQRFGQVKNAFIRVLDADSKTELFKYDLSEDGGSATAFILGKLYRHNGEWKFQAESSPANGSIFSIADAYR